MVGFSQEQIRALNNWVRTNPALSSAFKYTGDGIEGLGDLLQQVAEQAEVSSEDEVTTVNFKVTSNSESSETVLTLPKGTYQFEACVNILSKFNELAVVEIGDSKKIGRIVSGDEADLAEFGLYKTRGIVTYKEDVEIVSTFSKNGSNSGKAEVFIVFTRS